MWTGPSMPSAGNCDTDTLDLLASKQLLPSAVPGQYTTERADKSAKVGVMIHSWCRAARLASLEATPCSF
jgi:hypothetical protein